MNQPRDQHTIPEVYLKQFAFDEQRKKIYYFDKSWIHNRQVSDKSISKLYNRDIFTRLETPKADTTIETQKLGIIDDLYGKSIENIKDAVGRLIIPEELDLVNLICFLTYLPVRTTYFAERARTARSKYIQNKDKLIKTAGETFMRTFENDIHRMTIQNKLDFQTGAYLNLLNDSESSHYSINIMDRQAQKWREEIFKRSLHFVKLTDGYLLTSDNPFYLKWDVGAPDYGEKPIPISLTPQIGLILGKRKDDTSNLPIKMIEITSEHQAFSDFNYTTVENSHKRIYSKDKSTLELNLKQHSLIS